MRPPTPTPKRVLVAAILAFALAACDSGQPTSPTAVQPRLDAGGNAGPSATGSGWIIASGEKRTFSFSAITQADGSVAGHMQFDNRGVDIALRGTVTCVTVIGNQAYIGGTVDSTNPKGVRFGDFIVTVLDSGQGPNAPPDSISLASANFPPGTAAQYCQSPHSQPLVPIQGGNIEVHS